MTPFTYTAYDAEGAVKTGTLVAESEAAASEQLRGQGLWVEELKPSAPRPVRKGFRRALLSSDQQAVLTRQLSILIGAEMPVDQSLDAVRDGADRTVDAVVTRARAALLDGAPLAEALDRAQGGFAPWYIASVAAGEVSGRLADVLEELAEYMETRREGKAKLSTALIYPAFVAAVSLVVCGVLMTTVAPEIAAIFASSGRELPGITAFVMGLVGALRENALVASVVFGALVLGIITFATAPRLSDLRWRLGLAVPGLARFLRHDAAVGYLRTLGLVLASKTTVPVAVKSAGGVLSYGPHRSEAAAVEAAIDRGDSLGDALSALTFIPPIARQLIASGEQSNRLAPMASRAAQLVENALETDRKRVTALMEPLLMIVVGAFVLTIILAVLLPIFDLQSSVGL